MPETNESTGTVDRNFILQQGFEGPTPDASERFASTLLFQPRVVALIVLVSIISRSPTVYAALAALLWWSALLPALNPFELAYRRTVGRRAGSPPLGEAPPPRRFAQAMAGTFAAASAVSLAAEFRTTFWVVQALLIIALAALLIGRFCLGSFLYQLLRGRVAFAVCTLPWRRGA